MPGKDGGKVKPLKQAKGQEKVVTDDDVAAAAKRKADEKALKEAAAKISAGKKK
jgi:hypothetical protein